MATNPLGQYVLIGNAPFLVIGVLSSKGLTPRGDDMDNSTWLPYTTAPTVSVSSWSA
jgi:macrolide transport system ATP-binding/permease protein